MRILFISAYWPRPDQPHPAFFEIDQLRALADMGHEVEVWIFTPPWRSKASFVGPHELGLDPEQVRLKQFMLPRLPEQLSRRPAGALINKLAVGLWMRNRLQKTELRDGAFQAVIANGERNIGLSASIWNPYNKRPAVMIVHGADPVLESLPAKFLQRQMGGSANSGMTRIILVGNRLRGYAARMGYASDRIQVIPNGFNYPKQPVGRSHEPRGSVNIVSVARLINVKGLDDALQALARMQCVYPTLDWHFDIYGDGPEREPLMELAAKLGLSCRVQFHGSVDNETVLRKLEMADIFLLPSWNEAFGLVYLEAMAMGCAVIGCFENGAADILTDGIDGRLVPPRDVKRLADVLGELATDTKQREALATAAKESVKRFSWPANARAVTEALDG